MSVEEKRKGNTRNFLNSYYIQKDMSEASGNDEAASAKCAGGRSTAAIAPFDPELHSGQIRILADVERLTYVVLLHKCGDDAFVTTAFSHYDFPATDEEMALEHRAGLYLKVLQIWNTRTLHSETLKRSWLCGMLSDAACKDAWDFRLSLTSGKELPKHLLAKSGLPIRDTDDPRVEYMREEMAVFGKVDAENLVAPENSSQSAFASWVPDTLIIPSLWSEDLALAAGNEKENIRKKCAIDGRPEVLILEYSPEENTAWVDLFDEGGSRSTALDGAEFIDAEEKVLGVIADGCCEFATGPAFDGSIALRGADGVIRILTPIS